MLTVNQLAHMLFIMLAVHLISTHLIIELDDHLKLPISQRVIRFCKSPALPFLLFLFYMVLDPRHPEPTTQGCLIIRTFFNVISILSGSYYLLKDTIEFHEEYEFPKIKLGILLISQLLCNVVLLHLTVF